MPDRSGRPRPSVRRKPASRVGSPYLKGTWSMRWDSTASIWSDWGKGRTAKGPILLAALAPSALIDTFLRPPRHGLVRVAKTRPLTQILGGLPLSRKGSAFKALPRAAAYRATSSSCAASA
jgi:hypothetical protein